MKARHAEVFTTPEKPRRGDMVGATVKLDIYSGMAKVDLRASASFQRAWVKRELATMGSAVQQAWRALERYHDLPALQTYETVVDLVAPPIDTQEYSPDTTREIQYDARRALSHSRDDRTKSDRLPLRGVVAPRTGELTWSEAKQDWVFAGRIGKFELPRHASLSDTLGQSSAEALHGKVARVTETDVWDIVRHCAHLTDVGELTELATVLKSTSAELKHANLYDPLVQTCMRVLGYTSRRKLAKALRP